MGNGIPINLEKVRELEKTLEKVLTDVDTVVQGNPYIKKFQTLQNLEQKEKYVKKQREKMKSFKLFIKDFKSNDMTHRSYFMEELCEVIRKKGFKRVEKPEEELITGVPKWTLKHTKTVSFHPAVQLLLKGKLQPSNAFVKKAMQKLAIDKAIIFNKKYYINIKNVNTIPLPSFNVGSPQQKTKLFDFLGFSSDTVSPDTGLPSWNRGEVERVRNTTSDKDIKILTQAFIDFSFGGVIKNQFIKAFLKHTIDNRLYGNFKLFGAKSFRLTSSNPNLLNLPSTGSIYSKVVKRCLTAPKGWVILAIDYGALEDRVIASLSRDKNKCNIFLKGLDGHCLNAYGYFKDEVEKYMEITGDIDTDVNKFYSLVEGGHKELKGIRQKGKPVTFGLAYGAYPPKVAKALKIPIREAEGIFNRYHNELYPGIKKYREKYVLPTVKKNRRLHLGMGCYISSDSPEKDIKTLNNSSCQFWSILTLLTINKMHKRIDSSKQKDNVQIICTIYDSVYFLVKDEVTTIKWVNDKVVPIMVQDWVEEQTIKNTAVSEIGYNWADMEQISNGAEIPEIKVVLESIKEKSKQL